MSRIKRELFLFYSRPLFRTCEIICNHAARLFMKKSALGHPKIREQLERLNKNRIDLQRELNSIGTGHSHICAECRGKCCGGVRERDSFIDRIIQDPETRHLSARRKSGEMPAYKYITHSTEIAEAKPVEGFCAELTNQGCKIPYELRPMQCTAYFCRLAIRQLSETDCDRGIRALTGLMRVQFRTVILAITTVIYI